MESKRALTVRNFLFVLEPLERPPALQADAPEGLYSELLMAGPVL